MVSVLAQQNDKAYPELILNQSYVKQVLKKEEERFIQTLDIGMSILEDAINELTNTEINGEIAFKLYDTYGFPVDLTADVARERGLSVDMKGFEAEMKNQKDRARKAGDFDSKKSTVAIDDTTEFLGYELFDNVATIKTIIRNDKSVSSVNEG